jgi:hypothetical protein
MTYRHHRRGSSSRSSSTSRVMTLRRPDVCAVCGLELEAGTAAYWDAAARRVSCAEHDESERPGPDPFARTRSRGYYGRDAGRCEDAPCCGCCQ